MDPEPKRPARHFRKLFLCLATSLCCLPPALAAESEDDARGGVNLGARIGSHSGEGFIDFVLPARSTSQSILFFNPRLSLQDEGRTELNLGLVLRRKIPDRNIIFGANAYLDRRESRNGNTFDQTGLGLEVLSSWLDARLNYYHPHDDQALIAETQLTDVDVSVATSTSSRSSSTTSIETSVVGTSTSGGGVRYSGNNILSGGGVTETTLLTTENTTTRTTRTTTRTTTTTTTDRIFEQFEQGREGWDAEVMFRLPLNESLPQTRIGLGYYDYHSGFDGGSGISGLKGRLEMRAGPFLTVDAEVFEDKELNDTSYFLGARVHLPFDMARLLRGRNPFKGVKKQIRRYNRAPFNERLDEMVIRDVRIQMEQSGFIENTAREQKEVDVDVDVSSSTTTSVATHETVHTSTSTEPTETLTINGRPVTVVHVDDDNNGDPGDDPAAAGGTFENPHTTAADTNADALDADIVLVHGGSIIAGGDIEADDGDRILGEGDGAVHRVTTDQGVIELPETAPGARSDVRPNLNGGGVLISSSDVEVSNFSITSGAVTTSPGVTHRDITIRRITSDSNDTDTVIDLGAGGSLDGSITLADIDITNHGGASSAISIRNPLATARVTGTNIAIDGAADDGLSFAGSAAGAAHSFTGIDITNAANGIDFSNSAGSFSFSDTALENVENGIALSGGGNYQFDDLDVHFTGTRGMDLRLSSAFLETDNLNITGDGDADSIAIDLSGSMNPNGPNSMTPNIILAGDTGEAVTIADVNTGVLLGDGGDGSAGAYFLFGNQGGPDSGSSIDVADGGFTIDSSNLVSVDAFNQGRYEFAGVTYGAGDIASFEQGRKLFFVANTSMGAGDGSSENDRANAATLLGELGAGNLQDFTIILINDGTDIDLGTSSAPLNSGTDIDGFGNGNTIDQYVVPVNITVTDGNLSSPPVVDDPTGNGAATLTANAGANVVTLNDSHSISNVNITGGDFNVFGDGFENLTMAGTTLGGGAAGVFDFDNTVNNGSIMLTDNVINQPSGRLLSIEGGDSVVSVSTGTGSIAGGAIDIRDTTGGSVQITDAALSTSGNTAVILDNNVAPVTLTDLTVTNTAGDAGFVIDSTGASTGAINIDGASSLNNVAGTAFNVGAGARDIDASSLNITRDGSTTTVVSISGQGGGAISLGNLANTGSTGDSVIAGTGQTGGTLDFGTVAITSFGDSAGDVAISLQGAGGTAGFDDVDAGTAIGGGLSIGALAFTAGTSPTINATGGTALTLGGTQLSGTVVFDAVTGDGGVNGIAIDNTSGTLSISDGSITNTSGNAFDVDSSTASITYAGSITNAAGRAVEITNQSAGTVTFSGAIDEDGTGINLQNNTASTINFTGGLDLDTGANTAFNATGGGTVTVQGTANTIDTTTGMAVNVDATTIGTVGGGPGVGQYGMNFLSVSAGTAAAGPTRGIALNGAGSGGFRVTGTGSTDGSGGTIQQTGVAGLHAVGTDNISISNMNFTNANLIDGGAGGVCDGNVTSGCNGAIKLSSVENVALTNVDVNGGEEMGIVGVNVTNFDLVDSHIRNAGNEINEHGLHIRELFGTAAAGTGNSIINTIIENSNNHNAFIVSSQADPDNPGEPVLLAVTDSTFRNLSAPNGANGLLFEARSAANMRLQVSGSTFADNRGIGLNAQAAQGGTLDVSVTGSSFSSSTVVAGAPEPFQDVGISIAATQNSTITFDIDNNTVFRSRDSSHINVTAFDSASITGTISDNTNMNGSSNGSGVRATFNGDSTGVLVISANVMGGFEFGRGIDLQAREGSGSLDVTLSNNDIGSTIPSGAFANHGVFIAAGNATPGESNRVCVHHDGNSSTGGSGRDGYRVEQFAGTTFQIQDLVPATGATSAQIVTHLEGENTAGTAGVTPADAIAGTVVDYTASVCATP